MYAFEFVELYLGFMRDIFAYYKLLVKSRDSRFFQGYDIQLKKDMLLKGICAK